MEVKLTGLDPTAGTFARGAFLRDAYPDLTRLLLVVSLTVDFGINDPSYVFSPRIAYLISAIRSSRFHHPGLHALWATVRRYQEAASRGPRVA